MPCPYNRKLIEGMGRRPEGKMMKVMEVRKIGNFFPILITCICFSIRRA
ncbi:hypothetical protein [Microseira wollei]|nr:hypothetical protein [Microseira wollei]